MKKLTLIITLFLTASAYSNTFEPSYDFTNGKYTQYCFKTGNDGTDNKTGNDGTDNKTGNDGTDGKTTCQIIGLKQGREFVLNSGLIK